GSAVHVLSGPTQGSAHKVSSSVAPSLKRAQCPPTQSRALSHGSPDTPCFKSGMHTASPSASTTHKKPSSHVPPAPPSHALAHLCLLSSSVSSTQNPPWHSPLASQLVPSSSSCKHARAPPTRRKHATPSPLQSLSAAQLSAQM